MQRGGRKGKTDASAGVRRIRTMKSYTQVRCEVLADADPAIAERCTICKAAFLAGEVTMIVEKKDNPVPSESVIVESMRCHKRCLDMALRGRRKPPAGHRWK
jgi:hypothetical protein